MIGYLHTWAPMATAPIQCWGSGYYGQPGNGARTFSGGPFEVTGF